MHFITYPIYLLTCPVLYHKGIKKSESAVMWRSLKSLRKSSWRLLKVILSPYVTVTAQFPLIWVKERLFHRQPGSNRITSPQTSAIFISSNFNIDPSWVWAHVCLHVRRIQRRPNNLMDEQPEASEPARLRVDNERGCPRWRKRLLRNSLHSNSKHRGWNEVFFADELPLEETSLSLLLHRMCVTYSYSAWKWIMV